MHWHLLSMAEGEPVGVDHVRTWIRADQDPEDHVLATLLSGVRHTLESVTGCSLIPRTVRAEGGPPFVPPLRPVREILEVRVRNRAVDPRSFRVEKGTGGFPEFRPVTGLPPATPLSVTCKTGYGDKPGDSPEPLKLALLLMVQNAWTERLSGTVMHQGDGRSLLSEPVRALLGPFCTSGICP